MNQRWNNAVDGEVITRHIDNLQYHFSSMDKEVFVDYLFLAAEGKGQSVLPQDIDRVIVNIRETYGKQALMDILYIKRMVRKGVSNG